MSPAGISAEDWRSTPAAVRALVLTSLSTVAQLQRVAKLEERLNRNSRNSSRPASCPTMTKGVYAFDDGDTATSTC